MEHLKANNNELELRIGITAAPSVSFTRAGGPASADISKPAGSDGFAVHLEAALQYDYLGRVLNGYLQGKRFDISEGLIKNHVIVQNAGIGADAAGNLLIRVDFSGSFNGTVFFTGKPVYDAATKTFGAKNLNYALKSKSFLLNTAKWLFDSKIVSELKKHTVFPLQSYFNTATNALDGWLNQEWARGIRGEGSISEITLKEVAALPQHLLIRSWCVGRLAIKINEAEW